MIGRYLIALAGAAVITVGLLLFMDEAANRFILRDPTRYFRITDFIPAPDRGRQLPQVPPPPAIAPERPRMDYDEPADQSVDQEGTSLEMDTILEDPAEAIAPG